jgi:hypothetical protein
MLKVGFVEVLQFGEGWFHLSLASKLINSRERANRQFHFSKCTYKNAPGCEFSDVNDAATFEAAYSRLSSAHEQAIRIAALSRIHTTTAKDHSPALVRVLR